MDHVELVSAVVDLKVGDAGVDPSVEPKLGDRKVSVLRAVVRVQVRVVEVPRAGMRHGRHVHVPGVGIGPYYGRLYVPYGERIGDVVHALVAGRRRRAFGRSQRLRECIPAIAGRQAGKDRRGQRGRNRHCRRASAGSAGPARRARPCARAPHPPPQRDLGCAGRGGVVRACSVGTPNFAYITDPVRPDALARETGPPAACMPDAWAYCCHPAACACGARSPLPPHCRCTGGAGGGEPGGAHPPCRPSSRPAPCRDRAGGQARA